jgi:hypothetical protein
MDEDKQGLMQEVREVQCDFSAFDGLAPGAHGNCLSELHRLR